MLLHVRGWRPSKGYQRDWWGIHQHIIKARFRFQINKFPLFDSSSGGPPREPEPRAAGARHPVLPVAQRAGLHRAGAAPGLGRRGRLPGNKVSNANRAARASWINLMTRVTFPDSHSHKWVEKSDSWPVWHSRSPYVLNFEESRAE